MKKKLRALSNFDIDALFKGVKQYGGVRMSDELNFQPKNNTFYIINMDTSDGQGTHWILASFLHKDYNFFFDPFSVDPMPSVLELLKRNGKRTFTFDIQLQNLQSDACGYYCAYVAKQLLKKRKLTDILYDDFSMDTIANEKVLERFFRK